MAFAPMHLKGYAALPAARGCNWGIESLGTTERYRQISWRKALYLEGKTRLTTSDLSPKEATHMSGEVKYIGMDVHKEAIVIAVRNGSGKLVMDSIVEPKPAAYWSLSTACRGKRMSRGKKVPGRLGSTICSSPTCSKCWSAIPVATPY